MGYSLGTAVSVDLASRVQNVAGVVLLAPFRSAMAFADDVIQSAERKEGNDKTEEMKKRRIGVLESSLSNFDRFKRYVQLLPYYNDSCITPGVIHVY